MSFLISDAYADTAAGAASSPSTMQGLMSMLPMVILLVLFMYLMVIRPQSKKAKEHKSLIGNLQKGDEVVTIGGILGKIEKITDDLLVISIAENTNITIQKNAIANIVPRGTMKAA
jgi:preprotein translocase subunit YajC